MPTVPTTAEKIRRLPWTLAADATNSVFCTLTVFGSVFTLFLDELGLPKRQIGLILSLFPFCGLIAPFIAPWTARVGVKRTFLVFFGARKFVVALLLLTPWALSVYGPRGAFLYVAGVVLGFAICRAIAETAWFPWGQEVVPASIRGKFSALNMMVTTVCAAAAVWSASYVIGGSKSLTRFMILIAVGVVFGLVSVVCYARVPGGAPAKASGGRPDHFRMMREAAADRGFMLFLVGSALVSLATLPLGAFLPLYVKEQIGLTQAVVVKLQIWSMLGGVLTAYLWGWAADRFGSKPVMLTGLYLMVLLPVAWMLTPRASPLSAPVAGGLYFLGGVIGYGWTIGWSRHLYVSMVPEAKKTQYMALFYAWIGVVGGAGPLLAGRLLDMSRGISGEWTAFPLDPYTPLFCASLLLRVAGVVFLAKAPSHGGMPTREFAAMFVHGNPFSALGSLVKYNFARDESSRVTTTRLLAAARSPLNVEELIEAISDPSFNVRYEAIISMANTRPDGRLVDALLDVLNGDEPDLSIAAAWSLGRMGNARAIPALREALASGLPLLEARSARALATLGDIESIPVLAGRFRGEPHGGQRIAYASALGLLGATEFTSEALDFLRSLGSESSRMEAALTVARLVGREQYFVRRWRETRTEPGTALCQAVMALRRKANRLPTWSQDFSSMCGRCGDAFAADDLRLGARLLGDVARSLARDRPKEYLGCVLGECADRLGEFEDSRREYVLLALHAINALLRRELGGPEAGRQGLDTSTRR